MAYPLQSPGVDVTVIDESFYATAGEGTVPLIIIGTHEHKMQPGGTSVAVGTLPENANTLFLISSQRELTQTFGNPIFYSNEGTPQDGYELNEYGLHAAYQYLAQANSAYIVRGAIDYAELKPTNTAPRGAPLGGTYWLNTTSTLWGVFQSNGDANIGNAWVNQKPYMLTEASQFVKTIIGNHTLTSGMDDPADNITIQAGTLVINGIPIPLDIDMPLLGNNGKEGVVEKINSKLGGLGGLFPAYVIGLSGKAYLMLIDANNSGDIDLTGSDGHILMNLGLTTGLDPVTRAGIKISPSVLPKQNLGSTGEFAINTTYNNNVLFQKLASFYNTKGNEVLSIPLWCPVGSDLWNQVSPNNNTLTMAPHYNIPSKSKSGDVWVCTTSSYNGAKFAFQVYNSNTGIWVNINAPLYPNDTTATVSIGREFLQTNATIYVQYSTNATPDADTVQEIATYTPKIWNGANWDDLVYQAQDISPTTDPADGTLWYHNDFEVDIMVSTGTQWKGYRHVYPDTDPRGVILDATAPSTQSDYSPLVDNDLWINTSLAAQENYPQIYRYDSATSSWQLIDNTDNVTTYGIIFEDARWNVDGSQYGSQDIAQLVNSDFVDPDAPDPLLYPQGLLLFNTRYSSQNVKSWQSTQFYGLYQGTNYLNTSYFVGTTQNAFPPLTYGGRWVSVSGNNGNVPYMGRKAQRQMIVSKLKAAIDGNESLLAETVYFTLLAAPGYPELMSDMVNLNDSKKQIAFIVGDTPARLDPSGTSLINWATNNKNVKQDGDDGIVTSSQFLGVYYPWGLGTNVDGSNIVVPPSTMALRTIVKSDNMSYVWYTPAGYTRGLVDNATSVGYISPITGLYKTVILSPGQRDILYQNNINAIAFMPGRGLVVMGDKTRSTVTNAEDRINVARLVNYLRYNLDNIAKPFLFEPNVQHTQDSAKTIMERFLSNLIALNALYDFIVVCDSSNNTYQRVNNNELWIDIAIQPVKTIDFIYIPLRIESKGTNLGALYSGNQGTLS